MARRRFEYLGRPSVAALLMLLLLSGLYILLGDSFEKQGALPTNTPDLQAGWYSVYFTDPGGPNSSSLRGGPDQALALAIDGSRYSVEVAVLRLDLWSVRDALIRAHRRKVNVRVVTDSDNLMEEEIQDLRAAGVPVREDGQASLMHHKFMVIDQQEVWTGSMNFTLNGAYRNNNNLIRVHSRSLAESYHREFEEMFVEGRFGALSLPDTPHPVMEVDGSRLEAWFSPDDGVAARILELLRKANEDIVFMAYAFTSDAIANAMAERAGEGVEVRGVIEKDQAFDPGSEVDFLRKAGVELRLDGNPNNMHHKVMVIDGTIVMTGSYNFSRNAEEVNDENLLIIFDPDLAGRYLIEFERIYRAAVH